MCHSVSLAGHPHTWPAGHATNPRAGRRGEADPGVGGAHRLCAESATPGFGGTIRGGAVSFRWYRRGQTGSRDPLRSRGVCGEPLRAGQPGKGNPPLVTSREDPPALAPPLPAV